MDLDPLSHDYVSLAFGIERRFPGFVDAYHGPPAIRDGALAGEAPAPSQLLARALALTARIAASDLPEQRRGYLSAQARAMVATCRKLAGEALPYAEEVRACFDVEPAHTSEATFERAIADLDALLPGEGPVDERMAAWKRRYEVTPATALRLIDLIADEARRRARAIAALPAGETVEFTLVADKPWSGYNWYLGDARSRVEVNTDLPIYANGLLGLICHEAYPGHHTEHALKEQLLYREQGYGEHAIQLINTPECVIAEGIATLAETVIFPGDEAARWQADRLYPAAGLTGDPAREAAIAAAQRALRAVSANAALLRHVQGAGETEVVAYLRRYALRSEAEARHSLRFIDDPLWRAYVFTYHAGRDLLAAWLAGGDRAARFHTLLTEQVYPSLVKRWIAQDETVPPADASASSYADAPRGG